MMDPKYISVWLHKPVAALNDEKPLAVLANGDCRRLSRLISELESPTFHRVSEAPAFEFLTRIVMLRRGF
ncbi:MAG: hypothetical protein H0U65_11320 [Rubrobacter sp.]|nr:hypothetical protein [Rubrobacter sp.]